MGTEKHIYTAFGLKFASSIRLPELGPETEGVPDVTIEYGPVPESLASASDFGLAWQADEDNHLLSISEVGRYLIKNDNEILVEPLPGVKEEDIRVFLLGSVMGAILHAKEMLVLHSSVIQTKHGAVLFMGKSGMGKSTTLGAFLKRGYSMLTDDKACITINNEGLAEVTPGFPMVKLTQEAVDSLEYDVDGLKPGSGIGKYVIPVKRFCAEPLKVYKAYSLTQNNRDEISLEPLDTFASFETLNSSTYRRKFLRVGKRRQAHFKALGILSNQTNTIKVSRPANKNLIEEVANRIEEDFAK